MKTSKKIQLEFVIAPYLASTQMDYLYNKGAAQAICGPLDLLLSSEFPIIVSYDDKEYQWTTGELIMEKLEITKEQLKEIIILWLYPLDRLDFKEDLMTVSNTSLTKDNVKMNINKLSILYKYPVIFDENCVCRTINKSQELPKESDELLGLKLPTKCYLYLLFGLVSGKLISIISSGKSFEYSNIIKGNRVRSFNLNNKTVKYRILLSLLKGCLSMKPYLEKFSRLIYIDRIGAIDGIILGDLPKELYWNITAEKITEEMKRQSVKDGKINAAFCIKWYGSELIKAVSSFKKIDKFVEIKQSRELLCHAMLMYLEQRNFIIGNMGILILGGLFQIFPVEFQDEGMLFFELLAYAEFSGMREKSTPDKNELICKQLISEIFSLISMKIKTGSSNDWTDCDVTKEFINFLAIAKTAWGSCRDFTEGLLFHMFCSIDESKALDVEEFEKTFDLLPFGTKPNFLLGPVMLWIFNTSLEDNVLKEAQQKFPMCENIEADIRKGYSFWRNTIQIVTAIHDHKDIDKQNFGYFVEANNLLEKRFESIGLISGDEY